MKNVIKTIILGVLFISNSTLGQTIYIANSNPGATSGTNVFTGASSLQDAINAAVTGDIIHVIPSSIEYSQVTIENKAVTILGVGLIPDKNLGAISDLDVITINSAAASGTRISGVYTDRISLATDNPGAYTLSNILIENSRINRILQGNFNTVANLIIRNNIIENGGSTTTARGIDLETTAGVIITNNIIQSICCSAGGPEVTGGTIQNNLFYYGGTGIGFQEVVNCTIQNNIFYGASPNAFTNTGNSYLNNLTFGSSSDDFDMIGTNGNTGSGNLVTMDPLFTNLAITSSTWDNSWDITLQTGSPALNAGNDGTDIGPSGGANPFDSEGTFLPLIQAINLPATVTQGTDLNVNIKAKGN